MTRLFRDAPQLARLNRHALSSPRITVINGDLKFVRHPLMLGHYISSSLTGTEAVVDRLIGNTMSESLALRQYPDLPGTHQFFANSGTGNGNPLQLPRPECVVIAGLGANVLIGGFRKTINLQPLSGRMNDGHPASPGRRDAGARRQGRGSRWRVRARRLDHAVLA